MKFNPQKKFDQIFQVHYLQSIWISKNDCRPISPYSISLESNVKVMITNPLIIKQILLISTIANIKRKVWR